MLKLKIVKLTKMLLHVEEIIIGFEIRLKS